MGDEGGTPPGLEGSAFRGEEDSESSGEAGKRARGGSTGGGP